MAQELFPTIAQANDNTMAKAVVSQRKRQRKNLNKRKSKNVMNGWCSRDPIDIAAQILEVVSHQNLIAIKDVQKKTETPGNRTLFDEVKSNHHGVISVHYIRTLAHMSHDVVQYYVALLVEYGLMIVEYIKFKHGWIKKVPILTQKGRQFLDAHREVKGLLSNLFDGIAGY